MRTNSSHNNDATSAFKDINVDSALIEQPVKPGQKFSQNRVAEVPNKSSIFPVKNKEQLSHIANSLEIKNNNFEINNYYGNYTNGNNVVEEESVLNKRATNTSLAASNVSKFLSNLTQFY